MAEDLNSEKTRDIFPRESGFSEEFRSPEKEGASLLSFLRQKTRFLIFFILLSVFPGCVSFTLRGLDNARKSGICSELNDGQWAELFRIFLRLGEKGFIGEWKSMMEDICTTLGDKGEVVLVENIQGRNLVVYLSPAGEVLTRWVPYKEKEEEKEIRLIPVHLEVKSGDIWK